MYATKYRGLAKFIVKSILTIDNCFKNLSLDGNQTKQVYIFRISVGYILEKDGQLFEFLIQLNGSSKFSMAMLLLRKPCMQSELLSASLNGNHNNNHFQENTLHSYFSIFIFIK